MCHAKLPSLLEVFHNPVFLLLLVFLIQCVSFFVCFLLLSFAQLHNSPSSLPVPFPSYTYSPVLFIYLPPPLFITFLRSPSSLFQSSSPNSFSLFRPAPSFPLQPCFYCFPSSLCCFFTLMNSISYVLRNSLFPTSPFHHLRFKFCLS